MTDELAAETFEIERKYEVSAGATLPDAQAFAAIGFSFAPEATYEMSAVYFDTPDRDLAAVHVAVRRRSGGKDAGWHVKERTRDGARELHWPPSEQMPDALVAELVGKIGEQARALAPFVSIDTVRHVAYVRDEQGTNVVELADDLVSAREYCSSVSAGQGIARAWREWEAELCSDADPDVLDTVEPLLREAGATPSFSPAKIARASGQLVALAAAEGAPSQQLAALAVTDLADRLVSDDGRVAELRVIASQILLNEKA